MNSTPEPALSIIVPCYNEEPNVGELVRRIQVALALDRLPAEIVLVDDGSRDGTQAVIEALGRQHPQVLGLRHEKNRGIAGGWRTGLAASRAPYVLITDADLQYAPEDIPRLYRILLQKDLDVVQGWRIARSFKAAYRHLLSLGFSFVLNRLLGTSLRDVKSGFLCARREVFQAMLETRYRYRYLQHFIVVNAVSKGFRVHQEPVVFRKRHAGRSFIGSPLWFGLKALADLPMAFWEFRVLNHRRLAG